MSPVELDPKGSNVGTTTPYIEEPAVNEPPPEITNNFPLFDQSPTDRTGQTVGCVVEGFRQTGFGLCQQAMESARLGGIFGLVERAARMSAQLVKVGEWWRRYDTTYADKGEVIRVGIDDRYKLSDVYADNNWSAMSSIFTWEERKEQIIKHPDRKVSTGLSIFDTARTFLKNNEKCKTFLNDVIKQLSADTGVTLDGDIEYYLNQLEKTGTVNVTPLGKTPDGGIEMPYGNANDLVSYGTPGWGFNIGINVTEKTTRMFNSNMSVFFGELIHSIGAQNGGKKPNFGDDYAAKALENMGVAKSVKEYSNLPIFADKLRINGAGEPFLPFAESNLWHGIVSYKCGATDGKPLGLKD